MKGLNESAQAELDALVEQHGGIVLPAQVVEFARDENTALHEYFDWDDSEAAKQWRLEQARRVIRLSVTVIQSDNAPIRALVSLTSDRKAGGGYRALADILDDESLREQMERDALAELRVFRRKYERLVLLQPIWVAVDELETARKGTQADAFV